jgi:site-specific recombinase XerD
LVVIPSWAAHQLINTGEQPFGFLCTVNAHRDKPQLLSQDEVQKLLKDKDIDHYIQIPKGYFADTN